MYGPILPAVTESYTSDSASGNTFQVLFLSHPAKHMENKKFGGLTSTIAIPMNLQILWKLCLWLGASHGLRFWGFYQLWFQVWAHKRSASFCRPQGCLDQTAGTSSKSQSWSILPMDLGKKCSTNAQVCTGKGNFWEDFRASTFFSHIRRCAFKAFQFRRESVDAFKSPTSRMKDTQKPLKCTTRCFIFTKIATCGTCVPIIIQEWALTDWRNVAHLHILPSSGYQNSREWYPLSKWPCPWYSTPNLFCTFQNRNPGECTGSTTSKNLKGLPNVILSSLDKIWTSWSKMI